MTSDLTPRALDAVTASNRIARRAALFRAAAGRSKWGIRPVYLLGAVAMIYIALTWSRPWSFAAFMLILCVLVLEREISSRLDAVVKLLEQTEENASSIGRR